MKYKLLKYIEKEENSIKIWETFETDCTYVRIYSDWRVDINFLIREWYIEEVVVKKIDFSKFIWRDDRDLVIKWDNFLISWKGNVWYFKRFIADDKLNYIECELKDLEKWDVFILKDVADEWDFDKSDFKIYVWGNNNKFCLQYLDTSNRLDAIHFGSFLYDKAYKFLRE
jgi:hypothetical protein